MSEKSKLKYSRAKYEAYLGNYLSFGGYLGAYQNAFNVLVEDVERTDLHVDRIAYPMLFIARHCLELGFKANIQYFKRYSERVDYTNSDSHNLKDLLGGFKLHVDATVKNLKAKHDIDIDAEDWEDFKKHYEEVQKLTSIFDILDKGSFCFRYPVDVKGNKVFSFDATINLIDIKQALDKSMIMLTYTAALFSKYTDYADMIDSMYEEEMNKAYGNY